MKSRTRLSSLTVSIAVCASLLAPANASAHCDGLDGPVVTAAQKALATQNPALVLIWVQAKDEAEVRTAFEHALAVRALGPQARELADRFFFETIVRIHRAGEGAPYNGLQPAGRDLGPAIPAADNAIDDGSIEPLMPLLTEAMRAGVHRQFEEVLAAKTFDENDVAAGRKYVMAYVAFIHYVERLHEALATSAHGHFTEPDPASSGQEQRDTVRLRHAADVSSR